MLLCFSDSAALKDSLKGLTHSIYQDIFFHYCTFSSIEQGTQSLSDVIDTTPVQWRWIKRLAKPCGTVQGLCRGFGIKLGGHVMYSKAFFPIPKMQLANKKKKHIY